MNISGTLFLSLTLSLAGMDYVHAQISSKPSSTGKVPHTAGTQSLNPYPEFQPKPTGKIIVQDGVQVPAAQSGNRGQVPKTTTKQDPRTLQDRYQPIPTVQVQKVIEVQETKTVIQPVPAPASTQPPQTKSGQETKPN